MSVFTNCKKFSKGSDLDTGALHVDLLLNFGNSCGLSLMGVPFSGLICLNRTGVKYPIKQNIRCNSQNVVYLVTCIKCSRQYIGSTSTELKVRFRNHKSTMINNKRTCEVATHFNKTPHDLSDFKFIGIEQIVNDSDSNTIEKRLLTREAYWSAQLCTLKPYGLNKRCEFRSKNRLNFNN